MKYKIRYIVLLLSMITSVLLFNLLYYADGSEKNKPLSVKLKEMKVITLPKTGHRKPEIHFDHLKHIEDYNTECIDCHHKATNKKCSACHLQKDKGAVVNLKDAYHQQCHDCHRKTDGPKACGRCHKKEYSYYFSEISGDTT